MKTTMEIEAEDIPTMREMSSEQYKQYIDGRLVYVDHHGVLRSGPADYPLAVTRPQLLALIKHLQGLKAKVGE